MRLNSSSVCFQNFSTTPSFLKSARSFSTLGPELSPSRSTEYTPLPFSPLVPLATATSPVNGTPEVASPFEPAGYLSGFRGQHALIGARSLGYNKSYRAEHFFAPKTRKFDTNYEGDRSSTYVPRARREKQVTFSTLLIRVKTHHGRYEEFEDSVQNGYRCTLATSQKVRLDRTREVVDESHVRCFLGKGFEGQGDKRAGMAT